MYKYKISNHIIVMCSRTSGQDSKPKKICE